MVARRLSRQFPVAVFIVLMVSVLSVAPEVHATGTSQSTSLEGTPFFYDVLGVSIEQPHHEVGWSPQQSDPCVEFLGAGIPGNVSRTSSFWTTDCPSTNRPGAYARFFTFTLAQPSKVDIEVGPLSSQRQEHLIFLLRGSGRQGDIVAHTSHLSEETVLSLSNLAVGSYTIEVISEVAARGHTFLLTLTLSDPEATGMPATDDCVEDIGTLTETEVERRGHWTTDCPSTTEANAYARFYSFTLDQDSDVSIHLTSPDQINTANLLLGAGSKGGSRGAYPPLQEDGDTASSISFVDVAAGTYTLEAIAANAGPGRTFMLTLSALPPSGIGTPTADDCVEDIGTLTETEVERTGNWTADCQSENEPGAFARYYTFTLNEESDVDATLRSPDQDNMLNLLSGAWPNVTPSVVHSLEQIGSPETSLGFPGLSAGVYTIEVVAANAGASRTFDLTITVAPASGTQPTTDECLEDLGTLTADVSKAGTWTSDCASVTKSGNYARFYSFTLDEGREVTIDLTSSEDTVLSLLRGAGTDGQAITSNDDVESGNTNSQIIRTLEAGSYTIEATTFGPGVTGSFNLSVVLSASAGEPEPPPPDSCMEDLGTLTASTSKTGSWTSDCPSSSEPDTFARFYSFNLGAETGVTVDLVSQRDTVLYLRGPVPGGELFNNDSEQGNANSRISATLPAGAYRLEASTYVAGQTGDFTLTITLAEDTGTPASYDSDGNGTIELTELFDAIDDYFAGDISLTILFDIIDFYFSGDPVDGAPGEDTCVETVTGSEPVSGEWTAGCESSEPGRGYARYYTFTLDRFTDVTITLTRVSGDADPYLYLRRGAEQSGASLQENDNREGDPTVSEISARLARGTYTVEATTFAAGQTGSFTLSITGLPGRQRAALLALYQATGGDNWINNTNWGSNELVREWHGVITDDQGQVIGLELSSNGLTGGLPADLAWDAFTNLELLNLSDNQLTGQIPEELGDIPILYILNLSNNDLSGPIPPQLGNLTNLNRLNLHGNQLSGSVPEQLGRLSRLEVLYLSENRLSGSIPEALGSITGLRVLSLDNNLLTGPIPESVDNLSELQWLNLQNNELTGEMPAELGDLSNLNGLTLYNNLLTGEIPAELGNLSNLTDLELHVNRLTGEIPAELGNLSGLQWLNLQHNRLTGEIPEELSLLLDLSVLYLAGNNQLTGCIPHALRDVTENDFDALALAFCAAPPTPTPGDSPDRDALIALYNATGGANWQDNDKWLSDAPIGEWDGVLTDADGRVIALFLHNNRLTGTLPPDLGRLTNLLWLRLGGNRLTRTIPAELGNLANLKWLSLEGNRLSGPIPAELGNLSSLEALHLRDNWLEGEIPDELGRLTDLIVLDLGRNRLRGEIPAELGRLANLGFLYLDDQDFFRGKQGNPNGWDPTYLLDDGNYLHGEIPSELGNLPNLEVLHLFRNRLSGPIPSALGRLSNLVSLSLNGNSLDGEMPAALNSLSDLEKLDLRRNRLKGEIPLGLADLANLTELRLIGNDWAGCVPPALNDVPINDLDDLNLPSCTSLGASATLTSQGTSAMLEQGFMRPSTHESTNDRAVLMSILDKPDTYRGWSNLPYWGSDKPIGDWHGVTTEGDMGSLCFGHVTELVVTGKHLSGTIPEQLGQLSCLKELKLSKTTHRCGFLWLRQCGLTGQIPDALANLPLTEVDVSDNRLQGGLKFVWPKPQMGSVTPVTLFFEGNPWEGEDKELADVLGKATAMGVDHLQSQVDGALLERLEHDVVLVVARREGGERIARVFFKTVPVAGQVYTAYQWVDFALGDGEIPLQDYIDLAKGVSGVAVDVMARVDAFAIQGLMGGTVRNYRNTAYNSCLGNSQAYLRTGSEAECAHYLE